jgi:hypothetical protein
MKIESLLEMEKGTTPFEKEERNDPHIVALRPLK